MDFKDVLVHITEAFEKGGYNFNDYNIDVKVNNRLTKTLGRCMYIRRGDVIIPHKIELSGQLLTTAADQSIIDVIYHECAHALTTIETNEKHGHDAVFKAMCRRIGTSNDGITTNVERTVEDTEVYKYFVYCNNCGQIAGKYHRAGNVVKYPEHYHCKCGGSLRIVQNY